MWASDQQKSSVEREAAQQPLARVATACSAWPVDVTATVGLEGRYIAQR